MAAVFLVRLYKWHNSDLSLEGLGYWSPLSGFRAKQLVTSARRDSKPHIYSYPALYASKNRNERMAAKIHLYHEKH